MAVAKQVEDPRVLIDRLEANFKSLFEIKIKEPEEIEELLAQMERDLEALELALEESGSMSRLKALSEGLERDKREESVIAGLWALQGEIQKRARREKTLGDNPALLKSGEELIFQTARHLHQLRGIYGAREPKRKEESDW